MTRISPLYFLHGGRVVRGSLVRRQNQHRMLVKALNYVLPDGSDQPIALDFTRSLGHEETFGNAGDLLATLPTPKRRSRKNG